MSGRLPRYFESRDAALDLVDEEGKVNSRCDYKVDEDLGPDLIYKRFEFFQFFFWERISPEFHEVVGLWTSIVKRDYTVLIFVDAFVQMIEVRDAVCGQRLNGRDN